MAYAPTTGPATWLKTELRSVSVKALRLLNDWSFSAIEFVEASPAPLESEESKSLSDRVARLRTTALKGLDAYKCCKGAKLNAQQLCFRIAEKMVEMFEQNLSEALVFPPAPAAIRSFTLSKTASKIRIGVTGFEAFGEARAPATVVELQLQADAVKMVAEAVRKTEEDCLLCVESKLFGQSTPRHKVRASDGKGNVVIIDRRMPGGSRP